MNVKILAATALALALAGCNPGTQSANDIQRENQASQTAEIAKEVGMPSLPNARAARQVRWMYEAEDKANLLTYTYTKNMQGQWVWICDSVGYPVSLGTQFSAPTAMQRYNVPYSGTAGSSGGNNSTPYYGVAELPQSEPNGIYPPSNGDGTMVACINPLTNVAEAQRIETDVDAFTYPRPNAIDEPDRSKPRVAPRDPVMDVQIQRSAPVVQPTAPAASPAPSLPTAPLKTP